MTFSMSYQRKPQAAVRSKEEVSQGQTEAKADAAPSKPARTGRAARPNSPHARAEALFRKPVAAAEE